MTDKLKILLLSTDSLDTFYLNSGREQRTIENRIRAGSYHDRFEVVTRPAVKLSEVGEELIKYEPQAVHLIGDGRAGEGILLEDHHAEGRAVSAKEMADWLKRLNVRIRLLFLSICHTHEHAELISQHVDYVIGMRGEVREETALAFVHHFYYALGCGRTIDEAFNIATGEVEIDRYAGANVPVLCVRPGVDRSRPPFDLPLDRRDAAAPDPESFLRDLGTQFASQLNIVGHLQDAKHSQHAIYLDNNLYVHRETEEAAIIQYVEKFIHANALQGKWICVVGDAGHGKSSFLWYIYERLKDQPCLRVIPFLAQLEGHWDRIETTALSLKRSLTGHYRFVVIIDTLDILVGIADHSLAAMLNSLRSAGCLLITTSRRQEAERLFSITPSDQQIELKRFNDEEAQQAIQNFVNLSYPWWSAKDKQRQADVIWGILDQQRAVRELDLEPLILRMIFEAYVPDPIPRDINTQQVYERFWNKRVLLDYIIRTPDERSGREQLCRLGGRQIGFGERQSDKLAVDRLRNPWQDTHPDPFPHTVLESLISTGVLQWAEGVSTIRFFHQTFFEYTAAYDLLSSDDDLIEQRVQTLLSDVAEFHLFRAPILKQFAIQSFQAGNAKWQDVLRGLREINNELAAQMTLEIVGKLPVNDFSLELCREWVRSHGAKLQHVICETVRYYPSKKTAIALDMLEPYLEGAKAKVIYSLCTETFAKDAPVQVYEFLSRFLPKVIGADNDEQKHYKEALCATIEQGAVEAFGKLLHLFQHLRPGQRHGLLNNIAAITTSANAEAAAAFLNGVCPLAQEVQEENQGELWDGILRVACRLHDVAPVTGSEFGRWLVSTDQWKRNQTSAVYTGMIVGPTVSDPLVVHQSLAMIASEDHFLRRFHTGLLCTLPQSFSPNLMDQVLSLEKERYQAAAKVESLFTVVASLTAIEPAKILHFLEQWPWQDTGVGTSLRRITEYLAVAAPGATKEWLFVQLARKNFLPTPKLFSAFNILLQASINTFTVAEVRRLYECAFASSKVFKQIFVGATGSIARLDRELAQEIFTRVFTEEGKGCQVVAVNSLANCLDVCPEFAFAQAESVLRTAMDTHNLGVLHSYLGVLKALPRQQASPLLACLNDLFSKETLHRLHDNKTFGELLTILKIVAESDSKLTFEFSRRIPILNKGTAGGIAAVYDHISEHAEEEALLLELLESVAEVSRFDQVRISNVLRRILWRLDQKLGGRKVVEAVFRIYKTIENERALKTFVDAA